MKLAHSTAPLLSVDNVAVVFVQAEYGMMHCYQLVLLAMADLARVSPPPPPAVEYNGFPTFYWNAVGCDVIPSSDPPTIVIG